MGREYKTRVFKSGNSVAIRIPKALGLAEGDEFDLIPRADGGFELRRVEQTPPLTLAELFGCMPHFMAEGRLPSDAPVRDWDSFGASDKAA